MTIAVKVSYRHRTWPVAGAEIPRRLEGAVAAAQTRRSAAVSVGHGKVGAAVAVEIARHHGTGIAAGAEVLRGPESAVAVTQEYAHVVAGIVGDGEVETAI